ncbi:MAG: hypothetical protein GY739_20450, partial [Mesoflavibacter sp.]|nr:hypothetical protein [Mesoflavibacter sp.]
MCEFASAVLLQYKGLLAQYFATKPQIGKEFTLEDNVQNSEEYKKKVSAFEDCLYEEIIDF